MKKFKLTKNKEIEAALFILMFFGILSLHLWLFWIVFWIFFFLRFKHFVRVLDKIEAFLI